jgi:hypothetical protein
VKKGTKRGWTSLKTESPKDRIDAFRYVHEHGCAYVDGQMVDASTASLVCQIYDNINEANRDKFLNMDVVVMAHFAWKLGSKVGVSFGSK